MDNLNDVQFISADTLIVAGRIRNANQSMVVLTEDGGVTWVDRSPSIQSTYGIWEIHFFNRMEGIASTREHILKTDDGGKSWRLLPVSFEDQPQLDMAFLSKEIGFSVGQGSIWHITDAGENWVQESIPTTLAIHSVAFSDDSHAVAVGENLLVLRRQL